MNLLDVLAQKARVAGLVAAACAVTGVATAAAVAPSFSNVDSSTDVVATASPSVSPFESPAASPSASPAAEDDDAVTATPAASTSPKPCPSDVANHGAYVSSVAKDHSTTGREHGKAVSEAAHSDCGKTSAASPEPSESADGSGAKKHRPAKKHGKPHHD
ncbi:MAG: hypothetical protein ABR549_16760 [Mycobacteriales bacterium]